MPLGRPWVDRRQVVHDERDRAARWTFRNFFDLPSAPPPMTIVPASASTTKLVGLFCTCPSGETVASRPMCCVAR